jgi:hypothetical protein
VAEGYCGHAVLTGTAALIRATIDDEEAKAVLLR